MLNIPDKAGWYWATHKRGAYDTMPVFFQNIERGPTAYVPNDNMPAGNFDWHEPPMRATDWQIRAAGFAGLVAGVGIGLFLASTF